MVGLIEDDGEMGLLGDSKDEGEYTLMGESEERDGEEGLKASGSQGKHLSTFSVMYYVSLPAFLFTVPIFAIVGLFYRLVCSQWFFL